MWHDFSGSIEGAIKDEGLPSADVLRPIQVEGAVGDDSELLPPTYQTCKE